jgi:antitoxin (DNA-binding transcriptional repressor) of toxin-antitoxin stability system
MTTGLKTLGFCVAAFTCLAAAPASAQGTPVKIAQLGQINAVGTAGLEGSARPIAAFAPQPQSLRTRLDYSIYNDALNYSVLPLGQSTRRYMGKPDLTVGSRFRTGHTSPYRLEGSRISFSLLNDEYKGAIHEYRLDLERIGNEIDIVRLSRNEQLAFWFNLHNIVMIDQITQNYPVKRPSRMKVGGVPVDDAKLITLKGTPLSLRDIRERIVYPNWPNPNVIYGFFRGDIGSPALRDYAFTADNLGRALAETGAEFVNALRGFNEGSKTRNVSRVYDEAKAFYFPNFEADLEAHLLRHAREEVQAEIRSGKPMKIDSYDEVVADLVGGERERIATARVQSATGDQRISRELFNTLRELNQKRKTLRTRDLLISDSVIIEDIETPSREYDPNVDPASSEYVPPPSGN